MRYDQHLHTTSIEWKYTLFPLDRISDGNQCLLVVVPGLFFSHSTKKHKTCSLLTLFDPDPTALAKYRVSALLLHCAVLSGC